MMVDQYVEHEERRQAFKQDALQAWETYQETVRHLTGQEATDWLSTWGTDDERPASRCHQ